MRAPSPSLRPSASSTRNSRRAMRRRARASAPGIGRPRRDTAHAVDGHVDAVGVERHAARCRRRTRSGPSSDRRPRRPPCTASRWRWRARCAAPPRRAAHPSPRTSTRRDAPSPSRTTSRASSSRTLGRPRATKRAIGRPTRARPAALPATPLASSSTVSFVLMSPSTLTALKRGRDAVGAARGARRAARRTASVQHEDEQRRQVWARSCRRPCPSPRP